jgi:hypothetical protein
VNHSSVKPQTLIGQQHNQPQQYEPLLCQTWNINGQQYNQLQQYEPLLCKTLNSNGQQYNSHNNMNHSSVKPEIVIGNNITATTIWTTPLSKIKH